MDKNQSQSVSESEQHLSELMSEAERTAVRTLIHETITESSMDRNGTIDSVFSVLSHPGRRYVLTYLLRSEGYVTMSEIVDYVVQVTDTEQSEEKFRQEVTINLTHTHLPHLEEEGFIMYNMERQIIQSTEKTALAAPYLKVALLQRERLAEVAES